MTRRSFKIAAIGLVGFTAFSALAYLIVTTVVDLSCRALLYMFTYPGRAIIYTMLAMLVFQLSHFVYYKFIKK
ncbi:MAG: hypothetical protein RI982_1327 [Bacteroidota bacterium]|jgi:hypothetical protein